METKITTAEVCELAHEYTKLECEKLGIDQINIIDDNGETIYTDEVQPIFDRHFDLISKVLGV